MESELVIGLDLKLLVGEGSVNKKEDQEPATEAQPCDRAVVERAKKIARLYDNAYELFTTLKNDGF